MSRASSQSTHHRTETATPYRRNYPATVAEVLDDTITFKPAALRAVRQLARAKPWHGTPQQRVAKLNRCLRKLAAAYGIARPRLAIGCYGGDHYQPGRNLIVLSPRLSVVTFLHEFGHARGFDERQACRWSINLFRRCFPRSYRRCRHVGHTLVATTGN